MKDYYYVNEGLSRHIKNDKSTESSINYGRQLNKWHKSSSIRVETMHACGSHDKTLDDREELSKSNQKWDVFQYWFSNAKEKVNIKRNVHDKKEV